MNDKKRPLDPNDEAAMETHYSKIRRSIEIASGRGDQRQALTNNISGYNHRMAPTVLPKNRLRGGYVFFTRPDMNLSRQNIETSRRFQEMANQPINSAEKAILSILDYRCPYTIGDYPSSMEVLGISNLPGVVFDNRQAFIPILTNNIISLTGFPDSTLDVRTSEQGLRREQYSIADSHYGVNNSFTLNGSFKNLDGDIIGRMLISWLEAISNYYDGSWWPRMRNVVQREVNYQTRIYRLVMDPTNRYVVKIGVGRKAFPLNDNLGALMNMEDKNAMVTAGDEINVQFQCDGADYLDPILYSEFNQTVQMFNPDMLDTPNNVGEFVPRGSLRKIPVDILDAFNYQGYPRIDLETKELQWYVYEEDYQHILDEATYVQQSV